VHIIWHLTSAVSLLAFVGIFISAFYMAYHSILCRRHQFSAHTATPPINWQQSVEVPEAARPHARKMRNGLLMLLACFGVFAGAILFSVWVGY
jgi:hypothetical protein